MSTPPKKKILVCGDIKGKFKKLFARVSQVHEKSGPFTALLCLGQFTGKRGLEPLTSGRRISPIPLYFMGTPEDQQYLTAIKDNIIHDKINYIGTSGLKDIDGLVVAYYSAVFTPTGQLEHKNEEMDNLLTLVAYPEFKGVDILLTNEWPAEIFTNLQDNQKPQRFATEPLGSAYITNLASSFVPRYHFSRSSIKKIWFERIPYKNGPQFDVEKKLHVTRFFSIQECFNKTEERYIYAFNIQPLDKLTEEELLTLPAVTTDYPFREHIGLATREIKRQKTSENTQKVKEADMDRESYLKWVESEKANAEINNLRFTGDFVVKGGQDMRPNYAQQRYNSNQIKKNLLTGARADECWFCMSSAIFEMHMLITVGVHVYLSLAKGAINDAHTLICGVKHVPNQLALTEDGLQELNKTKDEMRKIFENRGESVVFFELSQTTPKQHLLIQAIPIPAKESGRAKSAFVNAENKLKWSAMPANAKLMDAVSPRDNYFWVQLPDGSQMVTILEDRILASTGRRAIAMLLGQPELEDWTKLVASKQIESKLAADLRKLFSSLSINVAAKPKE